MFEKIYEGEPILTVFSFSGVDSQQYRCFSEVYYVRTVSQPDIDTDFKNGYGVQMTETWFALSSLRPLTGWGLPVCL